MKKSIFSDEQIACALRQADALTRAALCEVNYFCAPVVATLVSICISFAVSRSWTFNWLP